MQPEGTACRTTLVHPLTRRSTSSYFLAVSSLPDSSIGYFGPPSWGSCGSWILAASSTFAAGTPSRGCSEAARFSGPTKPGKLAGSRGCWVFASGSLRR